MTAALNGLNGLKKKNIHNSSISLIDKGRSSREIEAQLGVGHMTVSRVRAEARTDAQKCRGGRPAKLTATDERRVVRMVTKGEVDNAAQAARQLTDITNKDVSVYTVRCALKRAELKARFKKKPRLLARHIVTVALPLER